EDKFKKLSYGEITEQNKSELIKFNEELEVVIKSRSTLLFYRLENLTNYFDISSSLEWVTLAEFFKSMPKDFVNNNETITKYCKLISAFNEKLQIVLKDFREKNSFTEDETKEIKLLDASIANKIEKHNAKISELFGLPPFNF